MNIFFTINLRKFFERFSFLKEKDKGILAVAHRQLALAIRCVAGLAVRFVFAFCTLQTIRADFDTFYLDKIDHKWVEFILLKSPLVRLLARRFHI